MRISVGNTSLFFDVEGVKVVPEGTQMIEHPTLILLHGGPGFDHSVFKPVFSELASIVQIIYVDLRGQGRSDISTPEHWNIETWADDINNLCQALGIINPIILGYSFGGFVALRYATRYPDQLSALILDSTTPVMNVERIVQAFRRFGGDGPAEAIHNFLTNPSPENQNAFFERCIHLYTANPVASIPESMARVILRPEVMRHFFANVMPTYDLRDQLNRINCPTLILSGRQDPICPLEVQEEMAAAIRSDLVHFQSFDNTSHNLLREHTQQAIETIKTFLLKQIAGK